MDIQKWWSEGEQVELSGHRVWTRRWGSGPPLTLLHGFPSSSHDWAKVAPALAERYALTMPDLLGFGASSKPREHRYSLLEQADLVEALWEREGIESPEGWLRTIGKDVLVDERKKLAAHPALLAGCRRRWIVVCRYAGVDVSDAASLWNTTEAA